MADIEVGDLVRVKNGSCWVSPYSRTVRIIEKNRDGSLVKIAECVWWLQVWRFETIEKADDFTLSEINT